MTTGGDSIAVTGLGCICAVGANVTETMAGVFAGSRNYTVAAAGTAGYPVFPVPPEVAAGEYASIPEAQRCGFLATVAAREAIADGGLTEDALRTTRVGICLGTTVGSAMNNESFYREFRDGNRPGMRPIQRFLQANPASMLARAFGIQAICQTVTNACSSGSVAIGQAAQWIREGVCDVALSGGADVLCNVIHQGFLSLLIKDTEPCSPFDRDRKGLNLGEGAGVLMLETLEHATRRGATAQAFLRGYGNASDAYHISAPKPDGDGLRRALTQAMEQAGIGPESIAFINAHGTATPENDRLEGRIFPELFPGTPFGSTKGFTGHTLGAAGGIEAVITIRGLCSQCVPASIGFTTADPEFPGVPVIRNTPVKGRFALSDSVAFGGNNAVLVFELNDGD